MNALLRTATRRPGSVESQIPRPKAILCISATGMSPAWRYVNTAPRRFMTLAGFRESCLSQLSGSRDPELPRRAGNCSRLSPGRSRGALGTRPWRMVGIAGTSIFMRRARGQLSIDEMRAAPFHYEIGKRPRSAA